MCALNIQVKARVAMTTSKKRMCRLRVRESLTRTIWALFCFRLDLRLKNVTSRTYTVPHSPSSLLWFVNPQFICLLCINNFSFLSVRPLMDFCLWWVARAALCLCQITWLSICSINKRSWSTPASITYCMKKTEKSYLKTFPKATVRVKL